MYIIVRLCNGFTQPLAYSVPDAWSEAVRVGSIVQVPLQKRVERAVVYDIMHQPESYPYALREILSVEQIPYDAHYHAFIEQLAAYCALQPTALYRRIHQQDPESKIRNHKEEPIAVKEWQLTVEQQAIVDQEKVYLQQPVFHPSLLHGVTGSGKTAVYQALIKEAYALGKTTLFLLPEVSLALTCARLLRATLGKSIPVHEFHSATGMAKKKLLWKDMLAEKPFVLVGVHLPILLPLAHLGLIIVDEEHDPGYQEKRHPRINTKEAALLRAQQYQIPIMLGSATPSISSWHTAHKKSWTIYRLTHRFAGAFPVIERARIVPQRNKSESTDAFWITRPLRSAIAEQLAQKKQTIIFLNRRGLHAFVQCVGCTTVFSCRACSVSLTLHAEDLLLCHYCGAQQRVPKHCPTCAAPEQTFIKKGIGTQRIVTLLKELFPTARIARADTDATKEQKVWQATVVAMQAGEIDILVGTQTITKGYNFPEVTLVGVIWAESNLSLPFYNATETMLQQLLQVAGRAGRFHQNSRVIVQSFIDHPVFQYMNEQQYEQFYHYEVQHRREPAYPPFIRLSEIELQHEDEAQLERDAHATALLLRKRIAEQGLPVALLSPALPPVHRIKHCSLRKIYLKSTAMVAHIALFNEVRQMLRAQKNGSFCHFTPNPMQ